MSVMAEATGIISHKRKRGAVAHPPRKARRTSDGSDSDADNSNAQDGEAEPVHSGSKHSKKERKQNRSTRIHSIRKLLERTTLPSTIRQEKERELAALLHEQEKTKLKKDAKKTLEKYHYVRFVERQKAEKRLKQLRKQVQSNPDGDALEASIHEMEVSRNYAIYAPLNQKYISVFASRSQHDNSGDIKPTMWYKIEEAMRDGQKALETIREGRSAGLGTVKSEDGEVSQEWRVARKMKNKESKGKTTADVPPSDGSAAETPEDDLSDGGFFQR